MHTTSQEEAVPTIRNAKIAADWDLREIPKIPSQKPLKPSNKRSKPPSSKSQAKPADVCDLMVPILDITSTVKPQISLWIAQL
jgi:hypothetical protein